MDKPKLIQTKTKNDLVFYYLEDDRYVGQRVALGKYEPFQIELMLRQIKEGDVVVDVGANIGFNTVLFSKKVGKTGTVYAFEPDPTNYSILRKNIEANNLKNVIAIQVALADKPDIIKFYISEENYGDHRAFSDGEKRKTINVECKTLDQVLLDFKEMRPISLIKIDTQGYEPKVIEGAIKTIRKYLPTIFWEYWPYGYQGAGIDPQFMMEFLKTKYKKIFVIDDWTQTYFANNKSQIDKLTVLDKKGYCDLFVKNRLSVLDYLGQFKDFQVKKFIKRIIGKI